MFPFTALTHSPSLHFYYEYPAYLSSESLKELWSGMQHGQDQQRHRTPDIGSLSDR